MAPSARPSNTDGPMEEDESCYGIQKSDRKVITGLWRLDALVVHEPADNHRFRFAAAIYAKTCYCGDYSCIVNTWLITYVPHGGMNNGGLIVCRMRQMDSCRWPFFTCVSLQTRKPLVEKKRRARINESLQELRTLLADADVSEFTCLCHMQRNVLLTGLHWFLPQFHSKMENAEVLEMTVKKVEDILKNRTQGVFTSAQTIHSASLRSVCSIQILPAKIK